MGDKTFTFKVVVDTSQAKNPLQTLNQHMANFAKLTGSDPASKGKQDAGAWKPKTVDAYVMATKKATQAQKEFNAELGKMVKMMGGSVPSGVGGGGASGGLSKNLAQKGGFMGGMAAGAFGFVPGFETSKFRGGRFAGQMLGMAGRSAGGMFDAYSNAASLFGINTQANMAGLSSGVSGMGTWGAAGAGAGMALGGPGGALVTGAVAAAIGGVLEALSGKKKTRLNAAAAMGGQALSSYKGSELAWGDFASSMGGDTDKGTWSRIGIPYGLRKSEAYSASANLQGRVRRTDSSEAAYLMKMWRGGGIPMEEGANLLGTLRHYGANMSRTSDRMLAANSIANTAAGAGYEGRGGRREFMNTMGGALQLAGQQYSSPNVGSITNMMGNVGAQGGAAWQGERGMGVMSGINSSLVSSSFGGGDFNIYAIMRTYKVDYWKAREIANKGVFDKRNVQSVVQQAGQLLPGRRDIQQQLVAEKLGISSFEKAGQLMGMDLSKKALGGMGDPFESEYRRWLKGTETDKGGKGVGIREAEMEDAMVNAAQRYYPQYMDGLTKSFESAMKVIMKEILPLIKPSGAPHK